MIEEYSEIQKPMLHCWSLGLHSRLILPNKNTYLGQEDDDRFRVSYSFIVYFWHSVAKFLINKTLFLNLTSCWKASGDGGEWELFLWKTAQ